MKRVALGLVPLLVLGFFAASAQNKPKSKKKARAPRVTAAQKAAAQQEIARRIAAAAGIGFENPAALAPFTQALNPQQAIHILQFGDSHTASDDWVSSMRTLLQTKYGDGGPGFVQAGRPYKGYRRFDAHGNQSLRWQTQGTMALRGDPNQGLSGISISTETPDQTVTLSANGEQFSIFYLQQPGGGQVEMSVDALPVGTFTTDGEPGPGVSTYPLTPGPHELSLRTLDPAWVRLYGWTVDNNRGLTFETLGINGAQAHVMLDWNETLWASQIAARNPALVILAYGTNEANSRLWTLEQYRLDMTAIVERIRRAVPNAAILMLGPPDCGRIALLHLTEVIAAQRDIAREQKVAFWDWRAHMGGPGSVKLWVTAGYGQTDYIHMTGEGYRMIGEMIVNSLLELQENEQARENR
jgi:lysophospholipase L1-like esterase